MRRLLVSAALLAALAACGTRGPLTLPPPPEAPAPKPQPAKPAPIKPAPVDDSSKVSKESPQ